MIEIDSLTALSTELRSRIGRPPKPLLIGIDGAPGTGKTTSAIDLGLLLSIPVVSLDNHVEPNRGRYADSIRYEDIRSELSAAMGRAPVVLVEGVCLRLVLERLGHTPNVSIYVKLHNERGRMAKADLCDQAPLTPEEIRDADSDGRGRLERDVRAYHASHAPITHADIIYKVVRQYA